MEWNGKLHKWNVRFKQLLIWSNARNKKIIKSVKLPNLKSYCFVIKLPNLNFFEFSQTLFVVNPIFSATKPQKQQIYNKKIMLLYNILYV